MFFIFSGDEQEPTLKSQLEHAIFGSDVIWNTVTIEIIHEGKLIQKYEQIIQNKSGEKLKHIKLPYRARKLHRNMKIVDKSGEELLHVPSDIVNSNIIQICEEYLKELIKKLEDFEFHKKKKTQELNKLKKEIENFNFSRIFCFDGDYGPEVELFLESLENIDSYLSTEELKNIPRLGRIYHLVKTYKGFYAPIIILNSYLDPDDTILISYSIEIITPRKGEEVLRFDYIKSILKGCFNFHYSLELEKGVSNHLKIKAPDKASLIDVKFNNIEISDKNSHTLKEKIKKINEFYDSNMLHIMFSPEESDIIWDLLYRLKEEPIEDWPEVEVEVSITKRNPPVAKNVFIFGNYSLLLILTSAMYLSCFIPGLVVLSSKIISPEFLMSNTTLTFVIALAIISHSFNREYLSEFSTLHTTFIIILWIFIWVIYLFIEFISNFLDCFILAFF